MASSFGILGKLEFLQVIASKVISGISHAVIHNIEKYSALKKAHYLTAVEHLEGDYLEFGVFTGSSFTHSMRCTRRMEKIFPGIKQSKFIGYDSEFRTLYDSLKGIYSRSTKSSKYSNSMMY